MKHYYTEEQDKFLKDNVKGISLKELVSKFNKKFNLNSSESAIANRKNKLHISSGITGGQFKKGNIPFNKGTKGLMKPNKTSFKKGNIPHNHRPVGSERVTIDGFIEIKVAEPNKWEIKSRYIYEKKYGKIPKGYKIIYLDGDKHNLELSNLKLVTYAEELIMNSNKLRFNNKETTESGYLLAKMILKRGNLKK